MAVRIYLCHYCGVAMTKLETTLDHIVPRARGGVDERFNWADACRDCNGKKADFWPSCGCNACKRSRRRHWEMYRIRRQRDERSWP